MSAGVSGTVLQRTGAITGCRTRLAETGSVVFGTDAQTITPFTADGFQVISGVQAWIPSGLSCLDCGILEARLMFAASSRPDAFKLMVVFADGTSNAWELAYAEAQTFKAGWGGVIVGVGVGEAIAGLGGVVSDPDYLFDLFGTPGSEPLVALLSALLASL